MQACAFFFLQTAESGNWGCSNKKKDQYDVKYTWLLQAGIFHICVVTILLKREKEQERKDSLCDHCNDKAIDVLKMSQSTVYLHTAHKYS